MRLAGLAFLVALLAACSSGDADPTIAPDPPEKVVGEWLDALSAQELESLGALTSARNLALVAGAENGFTTEQMTAIADRGLPEATARSYWSSFYEGFADFLGVPIAQVEVGGVGRFSIDGEPFAAVGLTLGDAATEVVLVAEPEGWRVDLVATAGPALAVQIRRLVAQLVDEADEDVARGYALAAIVSLEAALARDPANRALALELEAIEDLPIDLGA